MNDGKKDKIKISYLDLKWKILKEFCIVGSSVFVRENEHTQGYSSDDETR